MPIPTKRTSRLGRNGIRVEIICIATKLNHAAKGISGFTIAYCSICKKLVINKRIAYIELILTPSSSEMLRT